MLEDYHFPTGRSALVVNYPTFISHPIITQKHVQEQPETHFAPDYVVVLKTLTFPAHPLFHNKK